MPEASDRVAAEPRAPSSAPILTVPLESRRRDRALLMQKLQHALPAVVLLLAGVRRLLAGDRGWALVLAIVEVAVSALLLRAVGKELSKELRAAAGGHRVHGEGVDWVHLLTAGVLFAEAFEHWHTRHHLPRPTLLLALVMLALGLLHGRFNAIDRRRRALRLDHYGVRVGKRLVFLPPFSAGWNEIAAISIGEREARIRTSQGRERRINLADLRNPDDVRHALILAQEFLSGLPSADSSPAQAPPS